MEEICKWCGRPAKHQFKITKEYCCSKYPQQCPEFKKKLKIAKIGTHRSKESIEKQRESIRGSFSKPKAEGIIEDKLCDYGCGKKAKFVFDNKKVCCSEDYRKCPGFVFKKKIDKQMGPKPGKIDEDNILCDYGCGRKAKYIFKNGKYCCEESTQRCPAVKKPVNKKTKNKLSKLNKKPIEYWKEKYPLFSIIEKPKYLNEKIFVQCKNQNCRQWFEPEYTQLYERIRNIEREDGGGDYFYCSSECKNTCPIYRKKVSELIPNEEIKKYYSFEEYNQFRKYVLSRDDYKCQYCGKKAEHVHHERPKKLEPFFSLDPDLSWSVCKVCHYKYGHKDECSTGNIARKICS